MSGGVETIEAGEAAAAGPGLLSQAGHRLFEATPGLMTWIVVLSPVAIIFALQSDGAMVVAIGVLAFDFYWLLRSVFIVWGVRRTYRRYREAMAIDWLQRCVGDAGADLEMRPLDLHHLCLIPTYTEPYHVLEATVQAIVDARYPSHLKLVAIITRETDLTGWENVARLEAKFGTQLGGFYHVKDPVEPDALPGKSAAMNWGGRWMARVLREDGFDLSRVILTDLDSDYRVHPEYFAWLSWHHVREPDRDFLIWQPLPLFHNNIWQVPTAIRVMSATISIWQMYLHSRPQRLVAFSSYSCTLKFAEDVGFWDKDIIPEDSRFYWKAFFRFGERFAVRPVPLPLYGDSPQSEDYAATHASQYNQMKRWAWGITDVPYVMARLFRHPEIPLRLRTHRFFNLAISNHLNWILFPAILMFGSSIPIWMSQDFALIWLGRDLWVYSSVLTICMLISLMTTIVVESKMLPPKPPHWGPLRQLAINFQYLTGPVTLLILSIIPALEAHTRLLLGMYLEYQVTQKG